MSTLAALLPALDLTDSAWGLLDGDDFSMEFNIGDRDPVDAIMLHVRGGDGAIRIIQHICEILTGALSTQRPVISSISQTIPQKVCDNGECSEIE